MTRTPIGNISGPLKAMVEAVSKTWNPAQTRPEYDANAASWQLYLDLMELDEAKLQCLIERHGSNQDEPDDKLKVRKKLAVAFNLVPTIINMYVGYIFSEEPQIDVKGDKQLEAFLADCTGGGMTLVNWLRLKGLPYAISMGQLDCLVQNPASDVVADAPAAGTPAADNPDNATASGTPDAAQSGAGTTEIRPAIFPITPLHRINWAANNSGGLFWLTFRDFGNETENPFASTPTLPEAFITVSAARPDAEAPYATNTGFWIRSSSVTRVRGGAAGGTETAWEVQTGWTPVKRCAVASLFYRESLDPKRRHMGVSKLGTIAVLTRAIVNVLSWTTEDMLANLALLALPSKGGKPPTDDKGESVHPTLSPQTLLYFDPTAAGGKPEWLQGDTAHIKVKMEFVASLVQEILRQANLLGVSGDVTAVKSGVQGWVMRSELFQELVTVATAMDNFVIDLLALAKSWATGEEWTREKLLEKVGPTVNFHKGPYAIDPLETVILNAAEVIKMFGRVSPKMAEAAYSYVARSFLFADDPALKEILDEIQKNTGKAVETVVAQMDALAADIAGTGVNGGTGKLDKAAPSSGAAIGGASSGTSTP